MLALTVDGQALSVEWEGNASVTALRELVKQSPVSVQMSPYGGFEQVGSREQAFRETTRRQRPTRATLYFIRAIRLLSFTALTRGRIRAWDILKI